MKNSDIVGFAPEDEKWHICTLSIDYYLILDTQQNVVGSGG